MDEIKHIINNVICDLSNTKQLDNSQIINLWNKSLTGKEKEHCKVIDFKNKNLIVFIDCSAWLYQFQINKKRILTKIRQDTQLIENIYFKIGKIK